LIVRPESATIVYAGDAFSVRETLFVPVQEPGAIVIALQVDTTRPLESRGGLRSRLSTAVAGQRRRTQAEEWDPALRAFHFADEAGKFDALVGSPSAAKTSEEYCQQLLFLTP
jgi:hypothetical protein